MQRQINNIEKKVDKLYDAVVGDDIREGVVDRLKKVENYQSKDKKLKWTAIGAIGLMGVFLKYWDKIFG